MSAVEQATRSCAPGRSMTSPKRDWFEALVELLSGPQKEESKP